MDFCRGQCLLGRVLTKLLYNTNALVSIINHAGQESQKNGQKPPDLFLIGLHERSGGGVASMLLLAFKSVRQEA
jgi:hypothetical protein